MSTLTIDTRYTNWVRPIAGKLGHKESSSLDENGLSERAFCFEMSRMYSHQYTYGMR